MTPESFTILIDSREQAPLRFLAGWHVESTTLAAGDYSIAGLADYVAVERKSLPDLCGCITHDRDRFKRELQRLRAYRYRAVVVEADLSAILAGAYRSQVAPAAVVGSMAKWSARYEVPFVFAGDPAGAAAWTLAYLRGAWNHLNEIAAAVQSHLPATATDGTTVATITTAPQT